MLQLCNDYVGLVVCVDCLTMSGNVGILSTLKNRVASSKSEFWIGSPVYILVYRDDSGFDNIETISVLVW